MSEPVDVQRDLLQARVLQLYTIVAGLSIFGILVLTAYCVHLGPIIGPGVESSFGLAAGAMFLLGALLVHIVDRTYREWPLGRRVHPPSPGPVTDAAVATFLKVVVFATAAGSVAYLFWGILTT
ncbi:MAG: hypothetical protein L3K17_03030 [Thermoplasmata archaeon]|nr:hypothetical protein [Thermoplasmata archaeon]